MLLLIDNFDSFTYNLVQYFQILHQRVHVVRNNMLSLGQYSLLLPEFLVISPGPGNPSQAGISNEAILHFAGKIPILGVCLGHQCLAEVYGGKVVKASKPIHGKTSPIFHDGKGIFQGIPQGFHATRYHSLIVEKNSLPSCLEISAETEDGEIMALRHKDHPFLDGIQFHPESIKTQFGLELLHQFIKQKENDNVEILFSHP